MKTSIFVKINLAYVKSSCLTLPLIIIILLDALSGFSQTYNKFLSANNEWDIYAEMIPLKTHSSQAFLSGPVYAIEDTLVGSYSYKKAFSRSEDATWPANKPCLIREDTVARKVYILSADSLSERILYDFSLIAGDSIFLKFRYENSLQQVLKSGWYIVDSTGSIITLGGQRKTWFLSNPLISSTASGLPQLKWIEGIGSTISPVYLDEEFWCSFLFINPESQYFLSLTCAFHDSVPLFHDSAWAAAYAQQVLTLIGDSCIFNAAGSVDQYDYAFHSLEILPNPMTDIGMVRFKHLAGNAARSVYLSVTDASGRKLAGYQTNGMAISKGIEFKKSNLKPGIYFITLFEDDRAIAAGKLILH